MKAPGPGPEGATAPCIGRDMGVGCEEFGSFQPQGEGREMEHLDEERLIGVMNLDKCKTRTGRLHYLGFKFKRWTGFRRRYVIPIAVGTFEVMCALRAIMGSSAMAAYYRLATAELSTMTKPLTLKTSEWIRNQVNCIETWYNIRIQHPCSPPTMERQQGRCQFAPDLQDANTRDTVVVYSIVDCGFPPYQDGAVVDYISTTFSAEANYFCVKGYSSLGTGKAVCLSNGTWSKADFECSVSSHSSWQQVARTTASTTPVQQTLDLKDRISKTCKPEVRVKADFSSWSRAAYINQYGFKMFIGIWGMTVRGLTKLSWDSFETSPQREYELFVSDGKSSYMFVNDSGNETISTMHLNITWFVKNDQCISTSHSSDTGSVLTSMSEGEFDPFFDTYHVDDRNNTVCGQRTVDVSHDEWIVFFPSPYWFIQKDCSSGRQSVLRWRLRGEFMNTETRYCSMSWCPDTCWHHILDTKTSRTNKDKQIRHLMSGVQFGNNIMLKVEDVVAKAREVILHGGQVTVGVKEFWLPADKDAFSSGSLQAWMIASTSGRVVQCTHIPESPHVKEIKEEVKLLVWYLDSRQWDKVLSIDDSGTVLSGSKSTLLLKVNEGRSLRVGVSLKNGIYKALEVDSVDISRSGQIAVNIIHNVDLVLGQWHNWGFTDTCRMVSSIITTEGSYKIYTYNIGAGGNHSIVTGVAKIEWFIEL
ncbi:uncharacterized protein [Haliotis asinina]|uniref:uncharacterized protein n=1 Tax=Haliotis asinina TaxID=109174 RepID=UPI003532312A